MIISLHLPKTAGSSLGATLQEWFGSRLLLDYGDLIGDESTPSQQHRLRRREAMLAKSQEIARSHEVIHGHFYASKYEGVFPNARHAVFLRDPYTRIPSYYHYLRRCSHHKNPLVKRMRESKMSLDAFIHWDYMQNLCYRLLKPLRIPDLFFVGIQEDFDRSLHLLASYLGKPVLTSIRRSNVNHLNSAYNLTHDQRTAIRRLNEADLDIYQSALDRYNTLINTIGNEHKTR
jgi:hypothetical protein